MSDIIQKNHSWKCPFKKKICKCKHCTKNRENDRKIQNNNYYETKKNNIDKTNQLPSDQQQPISQAQQYLKAKNMQKLKNFIDFNGNMIMKFSKSLKTLNNQEIMYYHTIIYDSLKKLESIVNF